MNKIEYKKDIIVYEDFLSEEECKSILSYWEYKQNQGRLLWNPISFYESYAFGFEDADEDLKQFNLPSDYFSQLKDKIQKATEEAHNRPVKEVSYHAQKWIPGAFASFHSDNSSNGEYNAFERSKIATFLYLNDDFSGGELKFKDDPITIAPKRGMLATFEGGHENEHEVRVVEENDRFTIGSFWDYAESEYSQEKLDSWAKEIAEIRAQQAIQQKEWEELREKGVRLQPNGGNNVQY
jgi:Rps23 Pro-64 3,4-dihydroxylase Tpa1-like proline 4-hydroxylase